MVTPIIKQYRPILIRNVSWNPPCRVRSHFAGGFFIGELEMVIRKRKRNNMSIYKRWKAMKQRCLRTSHVSYKYYGGRGITVCDRWMDFELFYEDMGDPPKGKTLERINTNGNYEPGNCKWATPGEQAQNKRLRISSIRAIKKRKAKLIIMLKRNYNYYKEAGILEDLYLTEDEMRKIKLEASIAVSIIKEL